ncbi:MAG: hypothetical protein IT440_13245 [Phycisphaeraceae bacterium]|nr:hypothetical protein [Phycisphaeraceae bacterium]
MDEQHNPETRAYETLGELELEARDLAQRRDAATTERNRTMLDRQLREIEQRIERLKKRLRH